MGETAGAQFRREQKLLDSFAQKHSAGKEPNPNGCGRCASRQQPEQPRQSPALRHLRIAGSGKVLVGLGEPRKRFGSGVQERASPVVADFFGVIPRVLSEVVQRLGDVQGVMPRIGVGKIIGLR